MFSLPLRRERFIQIVPALTKNNSWSKTETEQPLCGCYRGVVAAGYSGEFGCVMDLIAVGLISYVFI